MDTKTTLQKIQELPQEIKDQFIELLAQDAGFFANMDIDENLSYYNWFRTFVISDDFLSLNNEKQKEVFIHYENASIAIRNVHEFFTENNVLRYQNVKNLEIHK